jgi:formylglycine-generating enzyme required for sulfatase activity
VKNPLKTYKPSSTQPRDPWSVGNDHRVIRGGDWLTDFPHHLRSAWRNKYPPTHRYDDVAFRLFRTQEKK